MYKFYILILACATFVFSQSVIVEKDVRLTDRKDGEFYFPLFSPDTTKILLTSKHYRGLWYLYLNTNSVIQLNNDDGAGYKPVFSDDGNMIFYKKNVYRQGKRYSSIQSIDLRIKKQYLIQPENRDQLEMRISGDNLIYRRKGTLHQINGKTFDPVQNTEYAIPMLFPDKNGIIIADRKGERIIRPLGQGHYIWASLSADKERILFCLAGRGTYISDLSGEVLVDLGKAHAPKWSADGRWIVYMDDKDDGERYISSTINVARSDGSEAYVLTDGDKIAMYPDWSPDGKKIVYHTNKGEIYLLSLKYPGGNR